MTPISQRNFSKKQKIALLLLIIAITITVSESFQWIGIDYPFYIMLPQGQTPDKIDFEDFIAFAQAFGAKEGDPNYNPLADTNTDGVVSFPDFIAFAGQFGLERPSTSEKFSINGRITEAEKGLAGATISIRIGRFPPAATTNDSGYYQLSGLTSGTYTAFPLKQGYIFTPDTINFTIIDSNVTIPKITAQALSYTVSGQIAKADSGLADVQIEFSGPISDTVSTDKFGHYQLTQLPYGNYTLTPYKEGYRFIPSRVSGSLRSTQVMYDFSAYIPQAPDLALDLDPKPGYQGVHLQSPPSAIGDTIKVEFTAIGGMAETVHFLATFEYDPRFLQWEKFEIGELFAGGFNNPLSGFPPPPAPSFELPTPEPEQIRGNFRLQTPNARYVTSDSGSLGFAIFTVRKSITETSVKVTRIFHPASLNLADQKNTVTLRVQN
jgi:hypothetical protein